MPGGKYSFYYSLTRICRGTLLIALLANCQGEMGSDETSLEPKMKVDVQKGTFGETKQGQPVDLYTLSNATGMRVRIITYGAIIVTLEVPDREGRLADVVLGFDTLEGYLERHPYFGCVVGRYANRIAGGRFRLDGNEYNLVKNHGRHHLHGGEKGFDSVVWEAREAVSVDGAGIELSYLSVDGEEGYPGNLNVRVTYTLTNQNALKVDYEATTDKKTIVNLSQHTYFNLAGAGQGDILGHEMMINADQFTVIDEEVMPTGEIRDVEGTSLDFRVPSAIGARIDGTEEQMRFGTGYDHNFVLNSDDPSTGLAARVREPGSGRVMEIYTTEPGVQFYSGNFLDGTVVGKEGKVYQQRAAFCLETQHFPNSPNEPSFPSTVLEPGDTYRQTTVFQFSGQ